MRTFFDTLARVQDMGCATFADFLGQFPDETYAQVAKRLGLPPFSVTGLQIAEAWTRGTIREAAQDLIARRLLADFPEGYRAAKVRKWSTAPTEVADGDRETLERVQAALAALHASKPPEGWRPTATDPRLRAAFDAAWPAGATKKRRRLVRLEPLADASDLRPARPDLEGVEDDLLAELGRTTIWDRANIYDGRAAFLESIRGSTRGQRALFATHWLASEVANGGFDQFFANSTGVVSPEALEGFRLLGASGCASIVERVYARFAGGVPLEREERMEALGALEKGALSGLDRELWTLLEGKEELVALQGRYVREHLDEFFRGS